MSPRLLALPLSVIAALALPASAAPAASVPGDESPDPIFRKAELLAGDDFEQGLQQWRPELEKGGTITGQGGKLDLDVAGGCTLWLKEALTGPVLIEYEATEVQAGGPHDRVSDLNCFWMARDARSPDDLFATSRSGAFGDYDFLRCYYVGVGGNSNTTTRFRRYIGEKGNRPLLPEHDLSAPEYLLKPIVAQQIQIISFDHVIAFYRDGRRLFAYDDPKPYTSGWFGFRTVDNHLTIRHFRVYRLVLAPPPPPPQP